MILQIKILTPTLSAIQFIRIKKQGLRSSNSPILLLHRTTVRAQIALLINHLKTHVLDRLHFLEFRIPFVCHYGFVQNIWADLSSAQELLNVCLLDVLFQEEVAESDQLAILNRNLSDKILQEYLPSICVTLKQDLAVFLSDFLAAAANSSFQYLLR